MAPSFHSKERENIYDVNSYTDNELLDILDLSNPTDRELEAKIIHLIRKYDIIASPSAEKLTKFYIDIYFHFFDVDDNDSQTFRNDLVTDNNTQNIINNISSKDISFSAPSIPTNVQIGSQVQLTSTLDYTKGKLNPLLHQTYKRTICIDSQYRDSKTSLSTDFTLNFTETLKDVVSLKLYAVQIPYTWYTISRNYGSNFIYLKGNSPGINNGYHDFKLTIGPGNYQQNTIASAIQTSIQKLPSIYTDVSFGNTSFNYDSVSCIASFQLDIQKAYNETNYHFFFSDTFYSPFPIDNINRNYHLNSFLGFNYKDYSTSSVYSSRNIPFLNSSDSVYSFDNSNNIIKLIQYASTINSTTGKLDDYNSNSYIYQSILISFPISTYDSYGNIARESQASIYNIVNTTISSFINTDGRIIDSSVEFNPVTNIDISGNKIDNYGSNFFKWNFKLNRLKGSNYPGSKLCLVVPSIEKNTTNPIWIGSNSCFHFTKEFNELNHLFSETNVPTSNYDISGNIYFQFICSDLSYNVGGINNLSSGSLLNGTYSLNKYISIIDGCFDTMNSTYKSLNNNNNVFIRNYSYAEINSNSKFHMQVDIARIFNTSNFRIDITNYGLNSLLYFSTNDIHTGIVLSDNKTFTSSINQLGNYTINLTNRLLMTIYTDEKYNGTNSRTNGISSDVCYKVYVPIGIYVGYTSLQTIINNTFKTYSDSNGSYPLYYSSINISLADNNKLNCTLTINIQKQLSQNNYHLYFYDLGNENTWKNNLFLDVSYNLSQLTLSGKNYADIVGTKNIYTDNIDLTFGGISNKFYLSSSINGIAGSGDRGSNDLVFTIPPKIYTRADLFNTINTLFYEKPVTRGSYISYVVDPSTNLEYTKIVWNINKIYTTNDYKIVFYDLYSFVSCFLGNSSVRNATWDTTLGWILGFRNMTEYKLSATNTYYDLNLDKTFYYDISSSTITTNEYSVDSSVPYRSTILLTADTTISVNLYNYFMVILDDFNQNHLNDGLITITPKDNSLQLPSYASRAKYICDPITGNILNTGITDAASNNLTQNQIYSINQIINAQNTQKGYTNSGVYVKDIFGLIPIKTTGMSPGQVYVELGGTLQNQDRVYFGPVNIHRMAIKLVNYRGDILDLNGANWSLQFICEQLYQTTPSNNSSS
jgi:hypothetical protein